MEILNRLHVFSAIDGIALALIAAAWAAIGLFVEKGLFGRVSVSILMADYRRAWMRTFVQRDPRILDANILATLREGTTFFASATLIALGGGMALMGNTERLKGLAQDFSLDNAPLFVWDIKLLLILMFMANALLKFVWSSRLFGYCAVVMASVPNDTTDAAYARAAQAAELNITAARSFNRGIRSLYFAMGASAWLLGPLALLAATAITVIILMRREFASQSRDILLQQIEDLS